jgi:hypothetical protein
MKRSFQFCFFILVLLALLTSSCNLPLGKATPVSTVSPVQQPTAAPATTIPTQTSSPLPVALATVTPAPPTATATQISHSTVPGDPTYLSDQVVSDCNTGARVVAGTNQIVTSGCDYWNREWLERPADGPTGAYVPALDIVWGMAGKTDPWIFLKLKVNNLSKIPDGFKAGFELDDDLDSRGEFLLLATKLTSTTWSTDGVQVWQDKNGDVGGSQAFLYDQNTSDGYETKLFDSGVGSDADLAWARISPKDANNIEFAFKSSLLSNPKVFGWWAWTGLANLAPDKFEIVDHEQDASAWNLDNSCSWIFGQKPKEGQLANLCVVVKPTATPTLVPTNAPTTVVTSCPILIRRCRVGWAWSQAACACVQLPTPTLIPPPR